MLITRLEIEKTREVNGQQFITGKGLAGERFEDIVRIEPHGFVSNPPAGSIGKVLSMLNGQRRQSLLIGAEHAGHRPSDIAPGMSALYDDKGGIIKWIGSGLVIDTANRSVTFTGSDWTINGPVTINGDLTVNGNITNSGTNPNHHSH